MRCRYCGSWLQPMHGHGACLVSGCPMFGLNQDECCNGEQSCAVETQPVRVPTVRGPVRSRASRRR